MSDTKTETRIQTYAEFWPYYLQEHSKPSCRLIHYAGTALAFIPIFLGIFVSPWWFLGWPVCGYGFAWFAHFFVENNKPATFTYPFWSLISDYKMFFKWITGSLGSELKAAGVS